MKKYHLVWLLFIITSSCFKDSDDEAQILVPEILGKWYLAETLIDPGDGTGIFEPVQSEKYVEFLNDGTVRSNGTLCSVDPSTDNPSDGYFSIIDNTITSSSCIRSEPLKTTYKLENETLIIFQPCYEGCAEKYFR